MKFTNFFCFRGRILAYIFSFMLLFPHCNLSVPTGTSELLFLFNDIQKLILSSIVPTANLTITGTVRDSVGNIVPGGVLDISRSSTTNIRGVADNRVYADLNGNFSMNVYVDSFTIRVSRSDGSLVGTFSLKVTSATTPPEVISSSGLQISGLSAIPVGTAGMNEPLKVVISGLPQVITEGQSTSLQIKLSKAISSNLSVVLSLNNPAMRIDDSSTKSLTFTPSNATTNQELKLTAINDSNLVSETVTLIVLAPGIDTVTYTLSALDTTTLPAVISISNVPNSLTEGSSATIGVRLFGNVTQDTTISISTSLPSSLAVNPSTITFTPNNYSIEKPVLLSALHDENVVLEIVSIIFSSPGINQVSFQTVTIDDDVQNIIITGTNNLKEGENGTISVRLTKEPSSIQTVNLSQSSSSALSLSSSALTFTPTNYNIPQNVSLTALQDLNQTSETVIISTSSLGIPSVTWNVLCVDDDTTIVFTGVSTVNESSTGVVSVALSGNPGFDREVFFTSGNTSSLTISPQSLVFTPSNYNIPQTLTITGVVDANILSENVSINASGNGLVSSSKTISVVDKDTMQIVLGGANTVNEGLTSIMTVALSNDPSGSLTVNLNSNNAAITLSPTSITFSSANYSNPQNITLTGVKDSNQFSETVTITASASGVISSTRLILAIELIGASGLLATGQTTSYATRDDGNLQRTVSRSFTDNNDGTITDDRTGLVYQKCSVGQNNCTGIPSTLYNQSNAVEICRTLNLTNRTWRLPNIIELANLFNYGKTNPAAYNFFPIFGSSPSRYWTASNYSSSQSFNTNFDSGRIEINSNIENYSVLCVSGPAINTSPTFTDNNDGTIVDNSSRLVWQKCSMGQLNSTCNGTPTTYNWSDALSACNSLNLANRAWRLPNTNEIRSIYDYETKSMNATFFPNTPTMRYWTSTTHPVVNNIAFYQWSHSGIVDTSTQSPGRKDSSNHARCVSGP